VSSPEVVVEFDHATQGIDALREAAYRLISVASCIIDKADNRYICRLLPKDAARDLGDHGLRQRFIDLVTDENLREKVSKETTGIRDVILALAFGALAEQGGDNPAP
jgi:His-Xaa-Ser system protein HxsD